MKHRWIYLETGEQARKGDKILGWNSNRFHVNTDDCKNCDPFIVGEGDHVLRKVVVPVKHLRAAKLRLK